MKLKESSKIEFKKSTAELKQALEDICAFANGGEGVLYFGINDDGKVVGQDIYVPETLVKCAIFDGLEKRSDRIVEYEDFRANIFEQIEGVQKFIQKHCRKKYAVNPETAQREPVYEWPLLAIREALSNAIAHRDYMISGHTDIAVFDDRIEVWSSGTLPEGIKIEDLNKTHKSVLRNPAIAEMLYFAGYIERWGSGIKAMNTLVKQAGLPEPIYEEIGSNFVVTFKKEKRKDRGTLTGTLNGTLTGTLNETLQTLYSAVLKKPGIQAKDLSDGLLRPIDTIKKQIKKLVDLKLVERRGSRKAGGYWVIGYDKN